MTKKDKRAIAWMNQMCEQLPTRLTAEGFERRSCILHTRLSLLHARSIGIRARALACQVNVMNFQWIKLCERLGREPVPADYEGTEAWSLGIGYGQEPEQKGYDAHVLTIVEERFALDLTIDQANRPAKKILLRPGYFELRPGFLTGDVGIGYEQLGSRVQYTALPDERGFLTVPDWTLVRANDAIAKRVLA